MNIRSQWKAWSAVVALIVILAAAASGSLEDQVGDSVHAADNTDAAAVSQPEVAVTMSLDIYVYGRRESNGDVSLGFKAANHRHAWIIGGRLAAGHPPDEWFTSSSVTLYGQTLGAVQARWDSVLRQI